MQLHESIERYKQQNKLLLDQLISAESEIMNLTQILDACSDAILITSPESKIIYVNPSWEKLMGYSSPEVLGKNPKFLQSGKTPAKYYKNLRLNLHHRQPFTSDELINKRKDGTLFPAHSTIYPVTRLDTILYYVQFLYDISPQVEHENQRQQLLSIVSHELKTPITVLKLLISRYISAKNRRQVRVEDLQNIDKELDRLTQLIDESLDISKIESNKLNLNLTIFDLNNLIKETINQLSVIDQKHQIYFSSPDDLFVEADYKRIKQVLINLVTNAVKYSPDKDRVEINTKSNKKSIIVSVKDYGLGIPKEEQTLIFDKSYQIKKRSSDGLGLGLYICKEVIKKHHGKIWVKSQPGKGSIFFFSIPIRHTGRTRSKNLI